MPRAPSAMPPSPPSPPAPPQSVVFETIAKQYSSFTSQLFDREENAAPIDHVDASTRDSSQRRRASAVNGSSRTSSVIIGGAELCPQFATMTVLRWVWGNAGWGIRPNDVGEGLHLASPGVPAAARGLPCVF